MGISVRPEELRMTVGAKIRPVDLCIGNARIGEKQAVQLRHIRMEAAVKRAHAGIRIAAAGKLRDGIREFSAYLVARKFNRRTDGRADVFCIGIAPTAFSGCNDLTFVCPYYNSAAREYATKYGYEYIIQSELDPY